MNSLSFKIGLGYFIIIILNLAIAVFAVYHINQLNEPIDRILKENYRNIKSAEQMRLALTNQELCQLSMVERGIDSILINDFKNNKIDFSTWHKNAVNWISLPREPIILDSIKTMYATYLEKSTTLKNLLIIDTPYLESKSYHSKTVLPVATEINLLCERLKELNEQAIFDANNKAKGVSYQAKFLITVFSVIAVLFSIIAAIYFTRKIILPVNITTETIRKIRRGQFNQKIPITTNDEIAVLGIEFNRMTDRLDQHIRDVSGLKKLDQLKSDFMSTISHEFKTPLTSINLAIDILINQKQGTLNENQKELLQQAKDDCSRLTDFAKELLDLAKLESGTAPLSFENVPLAELIDFSLKPFRIKMKEKDIQLIVKIKPQDLQVEADKKHINRVISNLIDNAINHSKPGCEIEIQAFKENEAIRFSVKDNGDGIPAESVSMVFEKFVQLGSQRNKGNIGLGLAISKEIISLHNGNIWVESEPGKGCEFIFTIPHKVNK